MLDSQKLYRGRTRATGVVAAPTIALCIYLMGRQVMCMQQLLTYT